jgi:hypothetical protein
MTFSHDQLESMESNGVAVMSRFVTSFQTCFGIMICDGNRRAVHKGVGKQSEVIDVVAVWMRWSGCLCRVSLEESLEDRGEGRS